MKRHLQVGRSGHRTTSSKATYHNVVATLPEHGMSGARIASKGVLVATADISVDNDHPRIAGVFVIEVYSSGMLRAQSG